MNNKIDRTGEVYNFEDGSFMQIIEYISNNNITIQFDDGSIIKKRSYKCFKKGSIKNLNKPSVLEIGFIGYGKYNFSINKKAYFTWAEMIRRCYDDNFKNNNKTYKNCSVHPDWHNFQNFAKWHEENYIEGFELDKDLLFKGNKIYNDKNCCFLPKEINLLISNSRTKNSNFHCGVFKNKYSFVSYLHINGKRKHLGSFKTEQEAIDIYNINKKIEFKRIANKYKCFISESIYNLLISYKLDINN